MSYRAFPRPFDRLSDQSGAALAIALAVLIVVTIMAVTGWWLSRLELGAAQGYTQSVRALYAAEAGLAQYFANFTPGDTGASSFGVYMSCEPADPLCILEEADSSDIVDPDDALDEYDPSALVDADIDLRHGTVTVRPTQMHYNLYLLTAEATVSDPRDTALLASRTLEMGAELVNPFNITGVATFLGGANFADSAGHNHFDNKAKKSKKGKCGSDGQPQVSALQMPNGWYDLPELPYCESKGADCRWHVKGSGTESIPLVDTTATSGIELQDGTGIDWSEVLSGEYFEGVDYVLEFDDSDELEAYFTKAKSKELKKTGQWPIVRFSGDLTTDQKVKGFGLLIVNGDLNVIGEKLDWVGLVLVGGTINTSGPSHIHLRGAAVSGLACSEFDRAAGLCRNELLGSHNDFKYRPCEINAASAQLQEWRPVQALWHESGGG